LFLLLSLNAILFFPSCDLLLELALALPLSGAINPGKAVDSVGDIDDASSNAHPAPDEVAGRGALGGFITIIILNCAIRELAAIIGLQNLNLCLAILTALPEPMLLYLAANPLHPTKELILDQGRWTAAGEHDPSLHVAVAIGLAWFPHEALANHDLPTNGHK